MNIKKLSAIALAAITAISLCGCDKQPDSSDNSSTTNDISQSTPAVPPVPNDPSFLRGALGEIIGISEITAAWDTDNNEISPELLTEKNFCKATTDSAYYALPKYPCRTSYDNTFDADDLIFTDIPQETVNGGYFRVKAGDTVCGMTVTEASSEFNTNSRVLGGITGTSLTLGGEKTLSGYAYIVPGDEYGVAAGDVIFLPSGNVDLPVVRFDSIDENGIPNRGTGDVFITGDLSYTNEFGCRFKLGNISDVTADISDIPTDGSSVKVNVTITNISMATTADWLTRVEAEIVSVTTA